MRIRPIRFHEGCMRSDISINMCAFILQNHAQQMEQPVGRMERVLIRNKESTAGFVPVLMDSSQILRRTIMNVLQVGIKR